MVYTITITDVQNNALIAVAKRDGTTVDKLVQAQIFYYLNAVIRDYVETPMFLTDEQKAELIAKLAKTKADYLAAL